MSLPSTPDATHRVTRLDVARWAALVALELNIGIHAALTPMHLDEKFYIGVLFCIGNAALFLAMLLITGRRTRILGWILGATASLVELLGFIASRTVGLPQGYKETWFTETEDLLGLVCLGAEAIVLVAACYALRVIVKSTGRLAPLPNASVDEPAGHSLAA